MDKKTSVTANEYELAKGVFQRMPDTSLWRRLDKDDFVITRFDEGYNSNIMKCELTKEARERFDAKPRFAGQPRAVVLKMIPPKNFIDNDPLEQALINVVAAEQGLAPKVLLATANSFIIEFVESRVTNQEDEIDPKMSELFAVTLARFHSMRVPVSRKSHDDIVQFFLPNQAPELLETIRKNKLITFEKFPQFKEKFYDELVAFDWWAERDRLWPLLMASRSPQVFSHNDLYRGNRLLTKDGRMMFIDFECCSYCSRGSDFGRYLANYKHVEGVFSDEPWPSDEETIIFLEQYRQEFARLNGDHWLQGEQNSIEQLLLEAKIFGLLVYLVDIIFGIFMFSLADTVEAAETFIIGVHKRIHGYRQALELFKKEGIIAHFEKLAKSNRI